MKETPLASIIVNNYNYDRFLAAAIDSALAQTYPRVEVLVVDDGSTDTSRQIIASYGSRIVPILKENGGQTSALNAGFAASRGDIVCFLDADDTLLPGALITVVPLMQAPDVVKVHWPLWEVDGQGRRTGQLEPPSGVPAGNLREDVLQYGPDNPSWPPTSGNAWSRWFLEQVTPLPQGEPNCLALRAAADAYLNMLAPLFGSVLRVSEPQAEYRLHDRNDHHDLSFDQRLERDLLRFDHRSEVLGQYCRAMALEPDVEVWKEQSWYYKLKSAIADFDTVVPFASRVILIDAGTWGMESHDHCVILPFLERDGEYWGAPDDDVTAIRELERMREAGGSFVVLAWPAFWWLQCYPGFHRHLQSHFPCLLENERLVVFDVRR